MEKQFTQFAVLPSTMFEADEVVPQNNFQEIDSQFFGKFKNFFSKRFGKNNQGPASDTVVTSCCLRAVDNTYSSLPTATHRLAPVFVGSCPAPPPPPVEVSRLETLPPPRACCRSQTPSSEYRNPMLTRSMMRRAHQAFDDEMADSDESDEIKLPTQLVPDPDSDSDSDSEEYIHGIYQFTVLS
eukprot:GHVP01003519.1.p1 GENE.GHVP01003519.1~~GHVP01003519.1.p1  ORF type:complete len:184 (+),score=20.31 GHVP01003519.1:28-579(+)